MHQASSIAERPIDDTADISINISRSKRLAYTPTTARNKTSGTRRDRRSASETEKQDTSLLGVPPISFTLAGISAPTRPLLAVPPEPLRPLC